MQRSTIFIVSTTLLVSTLAIARPADLATRPAGGSATRPASQPSSSRQPDAAERPPRLDRTMKQMSTILKGLDRVLADPKTENAAILSMINGLEAATVVAKNAYPDDVEALAPGEARDKAIADYRERMIVLLNDEVKMERAILRNDRDAARAVLATLAQDRKDGHEAYGVDDKHR